MLYIQKTTKIIYHEKIRINAIEGFIKEYCEKVKSQSVYERPPKNNEYSGDRYVVKKGDFAKYSLLTANCVHFTVRSTANGIRSKLVTVGNKYYNNPDYVFAISSPASLRGFMYYYISNYSGSYKSYSRTA